MIPIVVTNAIPTREYTSAAELAPAKVTAESVMRFKYTVASMTFTKNLLYIFTESHAITTIAVNVMMMARRLLLVAPSELYENTM